MPDILGLTRYALPLGLIALAVGIFDFVVAQEVSGFMVVGLILLAVHFALRQQG